MRLRPIVLLLLCPLGLAQTEVVSRRPLSLRLGKAVALATTEEGSADIRIAGEDILQARSRSLQARSALLPGLTGIVRDESVTLNLAALGLPSRVAGFAIPLGAGPLNVFDGRLAATQKILDWSALRRFRASRGAIQVAELARQDVKERVATRVAVAYLGALRAAAQLDSIREDVALAQAVVRQAKHQLEAGTGVGIEVTRAQVQLANACQKLLVAQSRIRLSHLQLLREMGFSLDTGIELADRLAFEPIDAGTLEEARQDALRLRGDVQAQMARENNAALSRDAARFERLPTVSGFADYGASGLGMLNTLPTRTVGIALEFPVFDGGRRRAAAAEAESRLRQEQIRTAELREQADLEMRMAIETLRSAEAQVAVAERGRRLAQRELASAQERYEAGVGNNLEVTDAQTRLERARDNHLDAIFRYNEALVEFGRSSGTLDRILERMDLAMAGAGSAAEQPGAGACVEEPSAPSRVKVLRAFIPPATEAIPPGSAFTTEAPPVIRPVSQTPVAAPPETIPPPAPVAAYAVQVAAFHARDAAQRLLGRLLPAYGKGCIVQREDQAVWRVLVGPEASRGAAGSLAAAMRSRDSLPAFVISLPGAACRQDGHE